MNFEKNAAGGAVVRCFLEAFHVAFTDSLPGTCILLAIAIAGVAVSKVVPLKLPIVAYVSIIGLLAASPISPCREFVIASAGKINFTAPLTMVGAYAGVSISDQINTFLKQGWKMILIGVFVMTGTFVFSAIIAQMGLMAAGAI